SEERPSVFIGAGPNRSYATLLDFLGLAVVLHGPILLLLPGDILVRIGLGGRIPWRCLSRCSEIAVIDPRLLWRWLSIRRFFRGFHAPHPSPMLGSVHSG